MTSRNFKIGCSGYYYAAWKNSFYPAGLPASKWLTHYSTIFNTVELNGTFYRTPKLADLKKYANQTPDGFVFSVKMNRYITHIMRLKQAREKISEFHDLVEEGLRQKLHNLLFQLPPSFQYTNENLENLLNSINPHERNVIEFRHPSWWNEAVFLTLKANNYTFCNTDYPGLAHSFTITSKNFYARMHGVPELFKSPYNGEELSQFARAIPACSTAYIYFNNTYYDAAYRNAQELMQLV
ncbi:MAG TPA: DUF72 domain-containing protein [Flavobacteriales bacterium]|nr:DUF72 domain-containing protein [Flavobacteriales bacterium]